MVFPAAFSLNCWRSLAFEKQHYQPDQPNLPQQKHNPASRTHDCNRWGRSDLYLFVQHRPLWSATQRESMCIYTGGGGVQTFRLKGQNRNLTANTYRNMLHRVE